MDGKVGTEARNLLSMVERWRVLKREHACAVRYLMCNASSLFCEVVRLSNSTIECVWRRDDEWGASDARSSAVMDTWRLPSSSSTQVDRSIA